MGPIVGPGDHAIEHDHLGFYVKWAGTPDFFDRAASTFDVRGVGKKRRELVRDQGEEI